MSNGGSERGKGGVKRGKRRGLGWCRNGCLWVGKEVGASRMGTGEVMVEEEGGGGAGRRTGAGDGVEDVGRSEVVNYGAGYDSKSTWP